MHTYANTAFKTHTSAKLSVLIPFYHDDPTGLLEALISQDVQKDAVEILIYDDGTNNAQINAKLIAIAKASFLPVQLLFAKNNKGRSYARNYLTAQARAEFVLFLDADMLPETHDFLKTYLTITSRGRADIIFGGFSVAKQSSTDDTKLHQAFSQSSDCLRADERALAGPQYVCSSNLCVRKTVLETEPFDPDFIGWGWEDSEWAARVSEIFVLKHIDNPALHLGLESTETLLERFRDSATNYVRFTRKHPELAQTLNLYKISQKLKKIPGQKIMRPGLAFIVRLNKAPTKIRLLALKLWRASWYAEALS